MKRLLSRLLGRLRHFRTDADLDDELRVHLEMQAEDNLAPGISAAEARRRANLQLGSRRVIIERLRDREFATLLESWFRDFALGIRALRKSPVFCLTAILTLALGIGANTAIFTLLYGLLLRSLPVASPQQLARISLKRTGHNSSIPYRMLQQIRSQQHSFAGISAWFGDEGGVTMEDNEGAPRDYDAGFVSGNGFQVLGMKPYLGRLIASSDDVRGGPPDGWPVVLSYGFWNDHFAADSRIVGKQIRVSDTPVTVIGVTPPDFRGPWPGFDLKLYLPLQFITVLQKTADFNAPTSFYFCYAIGRLKPGVSIEEANSEMAVYQKELLSRFIPAKYRHLPEFEKASLEVDSARRGFPSYFGRVYSEPLYLMQGLVAVVLLLCCVNVGGLMMSKVYARRHEFAVRTAMGAARWRLIRQYLMESFVIALAGAALGAFAAWYGSGFLLHFFRNPNMGESMSVRPDGTVFLINGLLAIVTTLFFGTFPAWRAGSADPGILLKSRTTVGGRRRIAGRAFVPIQVAMSLVLVALATLLSQSLTRIRGEYTGFDVNHVTIQTPPFYRLPQQGDAKLDLYQRMVDRIEQMPGIRSAAVTWYTPMTGIQSTALFEALVSGSSSQESVPLAYNDVGPGYFRTMKTKILAGREFQKNERDRNVCVVNQSAATYLFPHQQALGRYIRSADTKEFPETVSCRIIGIAEDAKFASLREPPPRTIYFPVTKNTLQHAWNLVFLMNAGTKAEAIAAYRAARTEIVPTIPLVLFATLREQMDAALGSERLITLMSNFFGGLALFLSALGLYGLLSSSIAQRTGEIGVRIALGAQRGAILRMILFEALRLLGTGVVLGIFALVVALQFVQSMLYGISMFDPLTLFATAALLTAVTLFAAFLPALRAASVDPIQALRAE